MDRATAAAGIGRPMAFDFASNEPVTFEELFLDAVALLPVVVFPMIAISSQRF